MKSLFVAAMLLLPLAARAAAHESPAQLEIVALERRLNDALSRLDATVIAKLWSEDFVFVAPNGRISGKAARLAGLAPVGSVKDALVSTIDEVSVRIFGTVAVAIVRTSWRGVAKGKPFSDPYIATHVWVKTGKSWQLSSAHVAQVSTKPRNDGS